MWRLLVDAALLLGLICTVRAARRAHARIAGLEQRIADLEYMQGVLIAEGSDLERRALAVPTWWAEEEDEEAYEDEE